MNHPLFAMSRIIRDLLQAIHQQSIVHFDEEGRLSKRNKIEEKDTHLQAFVKQEDDIDPAMYMQSGIIHVVDQFNPKYVGNDTYKASC